MKSILTLILLNFAHISFAQDSYYEKWMALAENDLTLQPEYGGIEKSEQQKESDKNFKADILGHYNGDTIAASSKMVELGFSYLNEKGDPVTAMKRFNQAYLLNSKNSDAYYGFGTVYFHLGAMDQARTQYEKGLILNPKNSLILTDYGTTYLGDYYESLENKNENSIDYLTKADSYLSRSYAIDKGNSNTIYKLSIVKMYLGNCSEAKSLLKKAKKMNNPNITESFERELKQKCG